MCETVELQKMADCTLGADDQSLYEAVNPEESTEDEYLEIRNISESVLKQNDLVYENTILNTSTEIKEICTPRDYNHENFHAVNKEIATIRESCQEQTTYLRRLQVVCIALGVALVISSMTIGVLMHLMRERIGHAEQKSENCEVWIGKLETKIGTGTTTNATLEERITKIMETMTIVTNNQSVRLSHLEYGYGSVQASIGNHTVILSGTEMERESYTGTIQAHNTRIEELEKASTNSYTLIQNHAGVLLELERADNTSNAIIQGHTTRIAELEKASTDSNTLIQTHATKLLELQRAHSTSAAAIQRHSTRIEKLDTAKTYIDEVLKQYNDTLNTRGLQIGFTAQGNTRSSSGVLRFTVVKSNIGSGYASATGAFTCRHPGLYYFSLSLIKRRDSSEPDLVYCYIRKNGVSQIYTLIDPNDKYADYGSYGTSVSLVLHLAAGDRVGVGGCSSADTIDAYSTLSGFLLKAD